MIVEGNITKIVSSDHHYDLVFNKDFDIYNSDKYIEYRKNWEEYPKAKIYSKCPLNIDIIVTGRCNLKCIMCYRTKWIERGISFNQEDMDLELYKKIIDEATDEEIPAIHLTGDGEPLLHNNIIEMIAYARKKNIIDLFMHTNATLLTKEMSAGILGAGLTRLLISIDSPKKETYESMRKGADFDLVMKNLKTFAAMKRDNKYPVLRVQMVITSLNKSETKYYEELFKPYVDEIGFTEYVNFFNLEDDGEMEIKRKRYREDFICGDIWRRMTIDVDGNAYACIPKPEALLIGKFPDQSIKMLWNNEKMTNLRQQYISGNQKQLKGICACGFQWK